MEIVAIADLPAAGAGTFGRAGVAAGRQHIRLHPAGLTVAGMVGVDADEKICLLGARDPGALVKRKRDIARSRVVDMQARFFQLRADSLGQRQRQIFFFHERRRTARSLIIASVTGIKQHPQRLQRSGGLCEDS